MVAGGFFLTKEERQILRRNLNDHFSVSLKPVIHSSDILKARQSVQKIYLDERIEKYILDIIFATRYPERYQLKNLKPLITFGGSPRASIFLALAAKANAFLNRRGFVIPEDVQTMTKDILRHRIGLSYEAEAEGIHQEEIISQILAKVEVP